MEQSNLKKVSARSAGVRLQQSLDKACKELDRINLAQAKLDARRSAAREKFFSLCDETIKKERGLRRLVIAAENIPMYPGWNVISVSEDGLDAVIEENPSFIKFSHDVDGKSYQRQIAQIGVAWDIDKIRQDHPEWLKEKAVYEADEQAMSEWKREYPGIDLAFYLKPFRLTQKLSARKASEE
jgi:allantoicase